MTIRKAELRRDEREGNPAPNVKAVGGRENEKGKA